MKLLSLTMKGFMSWCHETVIDFRNLDSFSVITGQSGAGKSAIFDAIVFCLYGKPLRPISKSQLINRNHKKNSFVKVEFEDHRKRTVSVERKLAGSGLKVMVDGDEIDPGHDVSSRQAIIDEIVGLTYQQFTLVVVLANVRSYSFVSLSSGERRKFVDDVFNLDKVESIRKKISKDYSNLQAKTFQFEGEKRAIESYILKTENNNNLDEQQLNEYNKKLDKLEEYHNSLQSTYFDVSQKFTEIKTRMLFIKSEIAKFKSRLSDISRLKECDRCGQSVSESHKARMIQSIREELNELYEQKKKLEDEYGVLSNSLNDINSKLGRVIAAKDNLYKKIDNIKFKVAVDKNYRDVKRKLKDIIEQIVKNKYLLKCYEEAINIMSDEGIKKNYYMSIYSLLSSMVTKILPQFGLNILVDIDNNGNITFVRGGEQAKYYSFSDGERSRIDLAFALAWSMIISDIAGVKIKTMLLDEVTINLDPDTVNLVKNYFYNLINNQGMQIVVVSHNETIIESVPFQLVVIKTDGCSRFEVFRQ